MRSLTIRAPSSTTFRSNWLALGISDWMARTRLFLITQVFGDLCGSTSLSSITYCSDSVTSVRQFRRPSSVIVGHKCTIEGRVPEESKVQKIRDWPECQNVSQVRGFLGTCGVLRMFIKDFSKITRPLINLTRKDVTFEFGPDQKFAMQRLKDAVMTSAALHRIDYESGREVILAVDT